MHGLPLERCPRATGMQDVPDGDGHWGGQEGSRKAVVWAVSEILVFGGEWSTQSHGHGQKA